MKDIVKMDFPIIGTKTPGLKKAFNLADPTTRKEYFQAKVGQEITQIRKFLDQNNFIAYFLGKKNAGKGTYSKLFSEAIGSDKLVHLSVGDLVREVDSIWDRYKKSEEGQRAKSYYRGYISFDEAVKLLRSRSASKLLPTEFILAILRARFETLREKSVFVDGFPRELDQISYSLFFKYLVGRENNRDLYILIDIPDSVINERIKYRVICPICHTPRNLKLLASKEVGFDEKTKEFYLMCDNPDCHSARMEGKEGDELGITPIKDRLEKDQQILEKVYEIEEAPKVLLRNSIPVTKVREEFDDYEITPAYSYKRDKQTGKIETLEDSWVIQDNKGIDSYSLLPAAVVISMIKQMAEVLSRGRGN